MSKRLPYFQNEPAEYLAGDIMICSYSSQGVFAILNNLYWQKDCSLSLEKAKRRIKNADKEFQELIDEGIIKIENGNIKINFLDNQFVEATERHEKLSESGKKGAEIANKNRVASATPIATPQHLDKIKEDKIKKEEIKENKEIDFSIFSHFKYSKETIHVYNFIKQNLNLNYLEINENWFVEFEKMVKEDERTPQDFNHCFNVLKNNEFYKPIVKDIFKLRKHFPKLLEQKIKVVMEELPTKPLDKTGGVWVNNKYTGKAVYCPYNPNIDLTDEMNNVKLQKPKK